jgi:hypothetical protein
VGLAFAGMGGAGGEALKQVADTLRGDMADVPAPGWPQLKKILTEGAKQAGYEAAGRGVGAVGKGIYLSALRPALSTARAAGGMGRGAALRGYDRLAQQGVDDLVLPSSLGTGRAASKAAESKAAVEGIAAASPKTARTIEIARGAHADQAARAAKQSTVGVQPNLTATTEQLRHMVASNPHDLSMAQLLKLRQEADAVARPAFDAMRIPGGMAPKVGSEASVARSVGDTARTRLNTDLGATFTQANQTKMLRDKLAEAVNAAAARSHGTSDTLQGIAGVGSAMATGDPLKGLSAWALLRLLSSPNARGAVGIATARAPSAQILRAVDPLNQLEK